jgi:hypothetical protein
MRQLERTYSVQALLVYAALGVALGMVVWALWIHSSSATGTHPHQATPSRQEHPNGH